MDSVGRILTCTLVLAVVAGQSCRAAENRTIRVTCTIPAIPGVNAPLVQQQNERPAQQTAYASPKEKLDPADEPDAEKPEENKSGETIQQDEEDTTVLVKTFYSR